MYFAHALQSASPEDARSCLYYTARYVKQAANFHKYQKDVFEDEERDAPSNKIRDLTLQIIKAIELQEGMPAEQFSSEIIIRLLDEITSFEAELSPELSEIELARGLSLAADMTPPESMRSDD
jgi:hypothetical protein